MDSLLVPTVVGRIGHPPACRGRATCVWAKAAITSCRIGDGVISRCCGISSSLTNAGNWTSCAGSACADPKNAIPVTREFLVLAATDFELVGRRRGAGAGTGTTRVDERGDHAPRRRGIRAPKRGGPVVSAEPAEGSARCEAAFRTPAGLRVARSGKRRAAGRPQTLSWVRVCRSCHLFSNAIKRTH